jgi:hypothetical protein
MSHHRLSLIAAASLSSFACSSHTAGGNGPAVPGVSPTEPTVSAERGRGGSPIFYRPPTLSHYRIASWDSLAMEMPDGSFQRQVTAKTAYLTVTLGSTSSGFTATFALDSLTLDQPNALLQPFVDSAQGSTWVGTIRSNGRIDSLVVNHESVLGAQIRTMLQRLFPVLPEAGASVGQSWTDSSAMPYQIMAGFHASEQRVAEYRALKVDDRGGTRAMLIQSTTAYTVQGSGNNFGQEITVTGSGKAVGTHHLSLGGRLLDAQVADTVQLTLTVPTVGQSVPTTLIGNYSITGLP